MSIIRAYINATTKAVTRAVLPGELMTHSLPLQLVQSPDVYVDEFETLTGWTVAGTGAVAEINEVQKKSGNGSLKLTSAGGGQTLTITKAVTWNFGSPESLRLWVYLHSEVGVVALFFAKEESFTNYFKVTYQTTEAFGYTLNNWNILNNPTNIIKTGTLTWSDINYFRIKLNPTEQGESYSLDWLQQGRVRTPSIVISFDGGYESHYTRAFQLMKERRMRGTLYIQSDAIGTVHNMTIPQLQEMNTAGWDIANHTVTHPDMSTLTAEQSIAELQGCEDFLTAIGCTRAVKHVAYPQARYNSTVLDAMGTWGAKTGRRSVANQGDYEYGWPYELRSCVHSNTMTAAQYIAQIDAFIARNHIPNCYFHLLSDSAPLGPSDWLVSDFVAVLDAIEARGLQTLTIDEYYRLYSSDIIVNHK